MLRRDRLQDLRTIAERHGGVRPSEHARGGVPVMCPGLLSDDEVLRAREILAHEPSLGDFLPHKFYGRTLESTGSWLRALEMFSLFQSARRARAWAEEIELDEPGDWLAPEEEL